MKTAAPARAGLILAALAALGGCGKIGPLEQPAPLFGAQARQEFYAQRAEQNRSTAARNASARQNEVGSAEAAANTTGADDAPLTTRDVKDPASQLTTPRNSPVPGEPNPLGSTISTTPPN